MKQNIKQLIAWVFFLALCATPLILKPYIVDGDKQADQSKAIKEFGVFFKDAGKELGIDFKHTPPKLDQKISNIMPQIASMGAGVSIVDVNNDGWQDIYLTNSSKGSKNALYLNNKGEGFKDVAEELGIADVNKDGASMGAVWGDHNNDGFEDLLLYKWGSTQLYENEKGESFKRVEAGLPKKANINTAIWFDYDRDGKLDIFLGGYFRHEIDLWNLETTKIMPESFEYSNNGGKNFLFRNEGEGKFVDVTEETGLSSTRWTLAVAAADVNADGFPDLFVSNDYAVSAMYLNQEGKTFKDIGESSGVGFSPKSGMNAAFGDVFNDGIFEIYESNIYEEGNLLQGNNLWQFSGSDGVVKYRNIANAFGVENGGWSWSAQFADLNNDGHKDIFAANGYVSLDKERSYWYDFATVTGGNESIISDTKNWTDMKGRSLSGFQNSRVWMNDGTGKFNENAVGLGVTDKYDGRAVAVADLFNDGSLDVIVANQGERVLVYKSSVPDDRNWVQFGFKTKDGRSPIGTTATLLV